MKTERFKNGTGSPSHHSGPVWPLEPISFWTGLKPLEPAVGSIYPLTRMILNERNVSKPNPFPFFFPPLLDPATAHFPIPSCYRRCSFPALPQAQRWGLHVDDSPLPDPTPRSHPPPSLIFSSLLAVIISAAPPPAVAFVTAASSSFSGLLMSLTLSLSFWDFFFYIFYILFTLLVFSIIIYFILHLLFFKLCDFQNLWF